MLAVAERTTLWAVLTVALGLAVILIVRAHGEPLVHPGWIAGIAVPWFAFGVLLRVRRDTLGREGRYVDLWSIPHLVTGVLLGLVGLELGWVVVVAVVWEVIEVVSRVTEHPENRVVDVLLAIAGWGAVAAVAGGLPAW